MTAMCNSSFDLPIRICISFSSFRCIWKRPSVRRLISTWWINEKRNEWIRSSKSNHYWFKMQILYLFILFLISWNGAVNTVMTVYWVQFTYKSFKCIKVFLLLPHLCQNITGNNSFNSLMSKELLLSPLYRWENWGTEWWISLPDMLGRQGWSEDLTPSNLVRACLLKHQQPARRQ